LILSKRDNSRKWLNRCVYQRLLHRTLVYRLDSENITHSNSAIYALTGFGFIDSLGAIGIIYFSFKEGKEAFEKARGIECSCED
jgi:hypothetical protein